ASAQERRRESIARYRKIEVGSPLEAYIEIAREVDREIAASDLSREGDVGPARHVRMIIDVRERKSRRRGYCRKAAPDTWQPKADAAFIGPGRARERDDGSERYSSGECVL